MKIESRIAPLFPVLFDGKHGGEAIHLHGFIARQSYGNAIWIGNLAAIERHGWPHRGKAT